MGLPSTLKYEDERYPYIVLTPIGKKNKHIRSIGHKFERSILSRLNDAVAEYVSEKEIDVISLQTFLNIHGKAILPVSFLKDDMIYPHLIKPELFLWSSLPQEHGLPMDSKYVYEKDITNLSGDQLAHHVREVIDDYLFLAEISKYERKLWLHRIVSAFHKHPIVQIAKEQKEVVSAVERMNQSALISLLKYPEDISYWRNRAGIVQRPFRFLPQHWLDEEHGTCRHQKTLTFCAKEKTIKYSCEPCSVHLYFSEETNEVRLEKEFDDELTLRRVNTLHQQFNNLADQNADLLQQLRQLSFLKERLSMVSSQLAEALHLAKQIERLQKNENVVSTYPLLDMYEKLNHSKLPVESFPSSLIWLSQIELADVSMVKQAETWQKRVPEEIGPAVSRLLQELHERMSEAAYQDDDIIISIKGLQLSYASAQQMLDLIHYYGTDYPAHTLVQVLAGKSTNKLRRLHLHETRWFGLLSDWPEKHIQRLLRQLEKQGWLMKQQKGYSISEFAEEVM
ncbi:RQC-minor-2 family DNA-binding protein [Halobacillus sp. Marseille-Q1614]|uniref:RQC-minor-2 family DNA-binding protein n=1 Tax=Halobacillus sp. Marseille-Q1614 TaxID=2709134 RepID=UPI00156E0461|nr:RQC-minor-2 family DNA-binding protein [Halobacillus sp. Marseille-Q1614]